MKARIFAAVLAVLGVSACTPDWATKSDADVFLSMDFVGGIGGGGTSSGSTTFISDVRDPSIRNDNAEIRIRSLPKNPGLANNDDFLTAPNDVILSRYTITYYRADGRAVEGVDVPYAITGDLNALVPADSTITTSIILVRHQAKIEPPLRNLFSGASETGLGGQRIVTMYAEVTLYGHTISQRAVSTRGRIEITFTDLGNA